MLPSPPYPKPFSCCHPSLCRGLRPLNINIDRLPPSCQTFVLSSPTIRSRVSTAVTTLAKPLSCPHPPSGRGSALLSPLLPNLCPALTHHQVEGQQSALQSPLLQNLCPALTHHQVKGQQSALLSPLLPNHCPVEINMPLQHMFCPNLFQVL